MQLKFGRRWFIALVLVGGVLIAARMGWTRRDQVATELVKKHIEQALSEQLGARVSVEGVALQGDPTGLVLEQVTANDEASGLHATAKVIRITLPPGQSPRAIRELGSVEISGLKLTMRVDGSGQPVLPERGGRGQLPTIRKLRAPGTELTVSGPQGWQLAVPSADLRLYGPDGKPAEITVTATTSDLSLPQSTDRQANPQANSTSWRVTSLVVRHDPIADVSQLSAMAGRTGDTGAATTFRARRGPDGVTLNFELQKQDLAALGMATLPGSVTGNLELTGTLQPLALEGRLSVKTHGIWEPARAWIEPGATRYQGRVAITPEAIALVGVLSVGESAWNLEARRGRDPTQPAWSVTAEADSARLEDLGPVLGERVTGNAQVKVAVGHTVAGTAASLTFDARDVTAGHVAMDAAQGGLQWQNSNTRASLQLQTRGLRSTMTGALRFATANVEGAVDWPLGAGGGLRSIDIQDIALSLNPGHLKGRGSVDAAGQVRLELTGADMPIDRFAFLHPMLERLSGTAGLKGHIGGTIASPTITAELAFQKVGLSNYLRQALRAPEVKGQATGKIQIAGRLRGGNGVRGKATFDELTIEQGPTRVENAEPIVVSFDGTELSVGPAALRAPHTRLTLAGRATRESGLALELNGETDLSHLVDHFADLTAAKGTLRSRISLNGKLASPTVTGELRLERGSARVLGQRFSKIQAVLSLRGGALQLQRATASWSGGRLEASGQLELAGLSIQDYDIDFKGRDQHVAPTRGMKLALDGALSLRSKPRGALPQLGGRITVREGGYRDRLHLTGLWMLVQRGLRGSYQRTEGPPRFQLAIDLVQAEPLVLRSNVFDAHLEMAGKKGLLLRGTDRAPNLTGRLKLNGRLMVQSTDFSIKRANIDFDPKRGLAPQVDLAAATRRGLTLKMHGDPDEFEIAMGCRNRRRNPAAGRTEDFRCRSVDGKMSCGTFTDLLERLSCNRQ